MPLERDQVPANTVKERPVIIALFSVRVALVEHRVTCLMGHLIIRSNVQFAPSTTVLALKVIGLSFFRYKREIYI